MSDIDDLLLREFDEYHEHIDYMTHKLRKEVNMTQHRGQVSHVGDTNGWKWFVLDGEDGLYYRLGKKNPGVKKGQYLKFQFEMKENEDANGKVWENLFVDLDTIEEVKKPQKTAARSGKSSSNYDQNQINIRYNAAVNTAHNVVKTAVEQGFVKITKAKSPQDMGAFEAFIALVNVTASQFMVDFTHANEVDWTAKAEDDGSTVIINPEDAIDDDDGLTDD